MPSRISEVRWERAKRIVLRQYPDLDRLSDRFWALVQTVYRSTSKSGCPTYIIKAVQAPQPVRQWEPPGGTHPATWRARVGDKYIYRQAGMKEREQHEQTPDLISTHKLAQIRIQSQRMSREEHEKASKNETNPTMRAYHAITAQKMRDIERLKENSKDNDRTKQKPEQTGQQAGQKSDRQHKPSPFKQNPSKPKAPLPSTRPTAPKAPTAKK